MSRAIAAAAITTVLVALGPAPARAQESFTWPEPQNLQKLPKDFTAERLQAVMTGFTRALGVRCSHCHVAEEGAPLSEHDFVSDANPNKNVARQMLDLLGVVNDKLDEIEFTEPDRVNMWCHTCHRGLPRPATLGEVLTATREAEGMEAALARFRELRARHYGSGSYDFSESGIESLARRSMRGDRLDDAIALMELNVEYYPESARAWGVLGDLYGRKEDGRERAIELLEKALELDPELAAAAQRLEQLRSEPPESP